MNYYIHQLIVAATENTNKKIENDTFIYLKMLDAKLFI